jgi:hypothetical protein
VQANTIIQAMLKKSGQFGDGGSHQSFDRQGPKLFQNQRGKNG